MSRRGLAIWLLVLGSLLLLGPGPVGRFLLDLLGGLTLLVLVLPLVAAGAGWLGWQLLRSRLKTCPDCGLSSFGVDLCPACGHDFSAGDVERSGAAPPGSGLGGVGPPMLDPRDVTIDVQASTVEDSDRP